MYRVCMSAAAVRGIKEKIMNDKDILLSVIDDIIKRLDSIGLCLNNVCNTGHTMQDCDYEFVDKQCKEIIAMLKKITE